MERQLIISYTPQQNGVSERKNQIVMEMAKSMLHEKGLPKTLWAEVVYTAVYLMNRCPTKAVWGKTPFEAWSGRKPSIKHLRVFGCICYAQIPKEKRYKLDETSEKCIFVGYSSISKGYRLYNLKTNKIIINQDVLFDEKAKWNWEQGQVVPMTFYNKDQLKKMKAMMTALIHHQVQLHHQALTIISKLKFNISEFKSNEIKEF
jgi:hypothetical protein